MAPIVATKRVIDRGGVRVGDGANDADGDLHSVFKSECPVAPWMKMPAALPRAFHEAGSDLPNIIKIVSKLRRSAERCTAYSFWWSNNAAALANKDIFGILQIT
ncbi:hypothetical protein PC116_g13768 [Phytophthora cactorum]|uniref:Uncharacterized protein n=1 Tax=Phytophthora cactorum TaxID=29920 RepID=A0A8T1KMY2_9STRA|nr:hypothetical protein PC113_g12096 [Phytophthora cactorum]KAG3008479.1 hypothetical protein PC119_g14230 [Phytophthora cactorum]KAG4052225.1 hypothetical protein PC123_g12582 [Phytophthora cactorum]KAG4238177.1 hypothetical protein PC116_g13768 [Phytophthora cactorum]